MEGNNGFPWPLFAGFLVIILVKVFAKYIFYSQRDPRGIRARREEERKKQLGDSGNGAEKRKASGYYVSGLFIYPIKSCKGIPLNIADIGRFGFHNDRRWMIVDAETKRFISQRRLPRMALITPIFYSKNIPAQPNGKTATHLQIEAPDMTPLRVPIPHLNPKELTRLETSTVASSASGDFEALLKPLEHVIEVTVWDDTVLAIDEGDEASEWLSKYLESPVRLVRLLHDNQRRVPKDYEVDDDEKVLNLTSFSDGFPFLLVNETSLADLNHRLQEVGHDPLPVLRFRPNILVKYHQDSEDQTETPTPFDEDDWKEIVIGGKNGIVFYPVKKCSRCKLTTVDPTTGEFTSNKKDGETEEQPLAILRKFRSNDNGKTVFFGQNLIHRYHPSLQKQSILIGDAIHVVKRYGIDVTMDLSLIHI
eukprot:TRINITY_DN1523_c0_g1_i1.p1 TRINITY_DN1523_c0_g1~~TRINITY_DN1523_c0_g1_i1.p1  ORF type:complete len:421 (-),score=83.54 TRINITY_DN1523_c0_g1_i1:50-1312(-)